MLFGIRGGGLFGGKDDSSAATAASASGEAVTKYPPMTQEEIEDWMEHIPVFAVTDSNGAGVVLKPDDDSSVFYFFLNPIAANATLAQLKSVNSDMDLKVSAFSLGKIWFKLLNADPDQEVVVSNSDPEYQSDMFVYKILLCVRIGDGMRKEGNRSMFSVSSVYPKNERRIHRIALT